MKCGHTEQYIMGCGDGQYCGVCRMDSLTAEIELAKRVVAAAKTFVDEFSTDAVEEYGYQREWNELCDAVFSLPKESETTKDSRPKEQTNPDNMPLRQNGVEKVMDNFLGQLCDKDAKIEQLRIDAERYRWLIEHATNKVLDPKNQQRIEVTVSYYGGGYQLVGPAISNWIDLRLTIKPCRRVATAGEHLALTRIGND